MIRFELNKITKNYRIYNRNIDRLKQFFTNKKYYKNFSALKNVSFKVNDGETLGIIGLNGSGKSTLLQIMCNILTPSSGFIKSEGKIAALLELGSGINPEFTGKENIYLLSSLYGLSKRKINSKFKQIVDFSGINEYINQPVKNYSSGMTLRLAFSIIAHVDADILVIDEALSVGDIIFSQKCMNYLRDFQNKGTIIYVTHDINSTLNFCTKLIWLHKGQIMKYGDTVEVLNSYSHFYYQSIHNEKKLKQIEKKRTNKKIFKTKKIDRTISFESYLNLNTSDGFESGDAKIISVLINNKRGKKTNTFYGGEAISLTVEVETYEFILNPIIGWAIKDKYGQTITAENSENYGKVIKSINKNFRLSCLFQFNLPLLKNGDYSLSVAFAEGKSASPKQHHWIEQAIIFRVINKENNFGIIKPDIFKVSLRKRRNA
jgi:lipopolysaccharide transport system ATP-binding protein